MIMTVGPRLLGKFHERCIPEPTTGCWLWLAATNEHGYGLIRDPIARRMVRSHRLSFVIYNGPLRDDAIVRHVCDNPPCVNPRHLISGTKQDNANDMVSRGRDRPWQRFSTSCKNGHPFTGQRNIDGHRVCMQCIRAAQKRCRLKEKQLGMRGGLPIREFYARRRARNQRAP